MFSSFDINIKEIPIFKEERVQYSKRGPQWLGLFLTEVPDMAKRSEVASVQVCSRRMATSVKMLVFCFS